MQKPIKKVDQKIASKRKSHRKSHACWTAIFNNTSGFTPDKPDLRYPLKTDQCRVRTEHGSDEYRHGLKKVL